MSRELKRVPLDFDWPINKTWEGYVKPERLWRGITCPDCDGGQTFAGWWLQRFCQRFHMLAVDVRDQQRGKTMHPWLTADPYPPRKSDDRSVMRPSADITDLIAGLTNTKASDVGYIFDSSEHKLFGAIVNAAGLPTWGRCATCDGEGDTEAYPGQKAESDAWKRTDPPTGDGYQAWESVSDGSPISPVFATAEEFIGWACSEQGTLGTGSTPVTREAATLFVDRKWTSSGVKIPGHDYMGGVEALEYGG